MDAFEDVSFLDDMMEIRLHELKDEVKVLVIGRPVHVQQPDYVWVAAELLQEDDLPETRVVMEYYIVNRGDERKWNKRTGSLCSTNLKSSRLGCLVFRDSVSTELEGSRLGDPIIPDWINFYSD